MWLPKSHTHLSYRDEGANQSPTMLMLHGLNAHSGTWRKNTPFLSNRMHVIAPSLPQWDGSSKYLDVSHYVELIEELLAVLRLSKVVMAGNSMGGLIAMQIAATKHGMIRALILEDSATGSEEEESILSERIDKSGIPVLIIWGREDKIIPVAIAERLHSKMTKSDLTILDETGHVPHWESPELFNIKVLNFLKLL